MAHSLKSISKALGLSQNRVEQWISRGHFCPPERVPYSRSNDWEAVDALRLALMIRLVEGGISPRDAGVMSQLRPPLHRTEKTFFVAWQGRHSTAFKNEDGSYVKMYTPGRWYDELVLISDLLKFVQDPDVFQSLVIDLDGLWERVQSALVAEH